MNTDTTPAVQSTPSPLGEASWCVLIAGGGTGGHLFPAIAIADAFKERDPANRICFVTAGTALDRRVLPPTGYEHCYLRVQGLKGRGVWRQFKALLQTPAWFYDAWCVLKRVQPSLVLGMGAYVAGPVALVARCMGKHVVLHEQNRVPGLTNRLLAHLATRIYVSFENTFPGHPADKVVQSGNPVRGDLLNPAKEEVPSPLKDQFTVLVIGGSQGAVPINQAMLSSLDLLVAHPGLHVMHQTGESGYTEAQAAYQRHAISAEVAPFFNDMAQRYARADLVICRAGATTVAEITGVGKAAILIPFPQAADDHQTQNAQALQAAGAGELMHQKNLDGPLLAQRILYYARHPRQRHQMARAANTMARPEAARTIVEDCYRLLKRNALAKARD